MKTFLLASLAAVLCVAAQAQSEGQCILAGRVSDTGRWAPQTEGVELLGADGREVVSTDKAVLGATVKQVRLTAPALLSRCDGNGPLALGPENPGPKGQVPALGAGTVQVEAVNFPKLRRGGELVELRVIVPAERVTMVTR